MKLNKRSIGEFAGNLSGLMLAILVMIAVSAVFLRYILRSPLVWAEEVESLMLMWIIMLGGVYALQRNSLLRMDILYNTFSPKVRRVLDIIQCCIHIVLIFVMITAGWDMALQMGTRTMSMLGIPMFWIYLAMPVGAVGMMIVSIIQLIDRLRGLED